jgi:hypothetical protein
MSIHDKIAKLPEWPDPNALFIVTWHVAPHLPALCEAALARLAEDDCMVYRATPQPCTCGRDALLAAITPPGEKT